MQDLAMDIRQSKLPPLILECQPFMIEAKLMQDGRIDVMDVNWGFNRRIPKLIRRPVAHASPYAATGKHHRVRLLVVITANVAVLLACPIASLSHGRATEFGAPDYESLVKQAPLLEVLDQSRYRLINLLAFVRQTALQTAMVVPTLIK